jgi:hypothetical protein
VTVLADHDVATQIADHLLLGDAILIDLAPHMGCACTGSIKVHQTMASREALAALEPPRSALPVIEADVRVNVELVIPHLTSSPATGARTPLSLEGRSAKPDTAPAVSTPQSLPVLTTGESRPAAPLPLARPRIAVTPSSIPRVDPKEHAVPPAPKEPTPPGTPTPITLRMLTLQPTPAPSSDTSPPAVPRRRTPTHGLHHIARQGAGVRLNAGGGEVTRAYAALRGRRPSPEGGSPPVEAATDAFVAPPEEGSRAEQELVDDEPHQQTTTEASPAAVAVVDPVESNAMAAEMPAPTDAATRPGPAHVDAAEQPTKVPVANTVLSSPAHPGETRSGPTPAARRPDTRRRLWGLLASLIAIAALTVLLKLVLKS